MPRPIITALLLFSASIASAQQLGPEFPLSAPSVAIAPYQQQLAGVASNGTDYLAIWTDRRSTIASLLSWNGGGLPALYVSRLDAAGRTANPFGFKLEDRVTSAALVWTSRGYMVFWSDGDTPNGTDSMVLNDDGVPITAPKAFADGAVLGAASNGQTVFLLTSVETFSLPLVVASIFTPDGTLLNRTTLSSTNGTSQPFVNLDGSYGFVSQLWDCPGGVPCTVTATLTTLSESSGAVSRALGSLSQHAQTAATTGEGQLLVASMNDATSQPLRSVSFRIFDSSGNPVTESQTIAATNIVSSTSGAFGPSVGWDGREFLIAWQWPSANEQTGQLEAVRVAADGTTLDTTPLTLDNYLGKPPRFASNGSSELLAWDATHIHMREASSFQTLSESTITVLPKAAALQIEATSAKGSSRPFVVWREGDDGPAIVASQLDGNEITISPAETLDQQTPAVGASSDEYLVVWREQTFVSPLSQPFRILAKRVSANGTVLDTAPIVIAQDPNSVWAGAVANTLAVGSDGTDFLVVWPASEDRLLATRVDHAGTILDRTPIELSSAKGTPGSPNVIWNGSQYVVVWATDQSCKTCAVPSFPPEAIFSATVSSDGVVTASRAVNSSYLLRIALAQGDQGLMLTWGGTAATSTSPKTCVYAMPLRSDGTEDGSTQEMSCADTSLVWSAYTDVDVVADGSTFITTLTEITLTTASVNAIRILSDGEPTGQAVSISSSGEPTFQPSLVSTANGVLLAYDRIAMEPQYGGVARIFARAISVPTRRRAFHAQ